jgi:hypothetical protein
MNKLLIGLLIIAAGAGIYFYLRTKENTHSSNTINKDLLPGKWKIAALDVKNDSIGGLFTGIMALVDTNTVKYEYEFSGNGNILRSLGDSSVADTSMYKWEKDALLWKEDSSDTTGTLLHVVILTRDSLYLVDADSTAVLFIRTTR